MEQSRLYRSNKSSVIAGVCGGLGDYLNTDPVLFRVLFLITAFIGGGGLLVYIVLWIVVPLQTSQPTDPLKHNMNMEQEVKNNEVNSDNPNQQNKNQKNHSSIWGGLILITLGALFLIDRFVPRIHFGDLWPVILIVIGVILISKSFEKSK